MSDYSDIEQGVQWWINRAIEAERERDELRLQLVKARDALEAVKGLQYYINNPSAWEAFDDEMSERLRPIVYGAIAALTDEKGEK